MCKQELLVFNWCVFSYKLGVSLAVGRQEGWFGYAECKKSLWHLGFHSSSAVSRSQVRVLHKPLPILHKWSPLSHRMMLEIAEKKAVQSRSLAWLGRWQSMNVQSGTAGQPTADHHHWPVHGFGVIFFYHPQVPREAVGKTFLIMHQTYKYDSIMFLSKIPV